MKTLFLVWKKYVLKIWRYSKDWLDDIHKAMHILNPEFSSDFKVAGMNLAVQNFWIFFYRDVDKTTTALLEMQQFINVRCVDTYAANVRNNVPSSSYCFVLL